jgi:hypothetical protein
MIYFGEYSIEYRTDLRKWEVMRGKGFVRHADSMQGALEVIQRDRGEIPCRKL